MCEEQSTDCVFVEITKLLNITGTGRPFCDAHILSATKTYNGPDIYETREAPLDTWYMIRKHTVHKAKESTEFVARFAIVMGMRRLMYDTLRYILGNKIM